MRERGCNGEKNGELLRLAEREFDALVTVDRNLQHRQNSSVLNLAVIVLRARSDAFPMVATLIPEVNEALRAIQSGEVVHVAG